MLGTKIYKTDMSNYTECAVWCNSNNATIQDKGNYYEVVAIPSPTFDELKAKKLKLVDKLTADKIVGGFTSTVSGESVKYDSDKDTQLTMQGIALNVNTPLFAEKYPDGCPVRGYAGESTTKSIFMLSAEQVMQWCADLSIHIGLCKQEGWIMQEQINNCTTVEELDALFNKEV